MMVGNRPGVSVLACPCAACTVEETRRFVYAARQMLHFVRAHCELVVRRLFKHRTWVVCVRMVTQGRSQCIVFMLVLDMRLWGWPWGLTDFETFQEGDKSTKVSKLKKGEFLMINIGSTSVGGRVAGIKPEMAKLELTGPVCTRVSSVIARGTRWWPSLHVVRISVFRLLCFC